MGLNTRQLKKTPDPKKPRKPKDVIYDPMGQWNHPGKVTRIPGGDITMQGVPYPVMGVDNLGNHQMMMPGMDYMFPGAQYVTEYPHIDYYPVDEDFYGKGGMIKRKDGSYSKRGLWDNIRANKGSGKKPTKEMLEQERKIKAEYQRGGPIMVNDLNDPRLRAYNDSLSAYNLTKKYDSIFKINTTDPRMKDYDKASQKIIKRTGIQPTSIKTDSWEAPMDKNFSPGAMEQAWMGRFKKPIQHYMYSPKQEKVTITSIQPKITGINTNDTQSVYLPIPQSPVNPLPVDDIQLYSAHQYLANQGLPIGYVIEDGVKKEVTADEYNLLKSSTITGGNKLDMNNYKNGGIAFPQQPTMDRFFKRGWVPQGPVGFYKQGGTLPEAFPQQPTAKQFFDFGVVPQGPVGFYSHGGVPEAFPQQPTADVFFSGASWDPTYAAGGVPCMECGGYMDQGGNVTNDYKEGGQWIQKATDSIKRRGTEGVCTGSKFGGPGCPPGSKRYNLAKTFRAMAKKRAEGGQIDGDDQDDFLANYRNQFVNHVKQNLYFNLADQAAQEMGDQQDEYTQMYGGQMYAQAGMQVPGNPQYDEELYAYNPNDYLPQNNMSVNNGFNNEMRNAKRNKFNGPLYANLALTGLDTVNSILNNRENSDMYDYMQNNSLADNQMYSMGANRIQDQGRYNWTGMSDGMMDPNSMNVVQQPGMNYARFQEGGTYELDDEEIDQILKMGGTIQYIK